MKAIGSVLQVLGVVALAVLTINILTRPWGSLTDSQMFIAALGTVASGRFLEALAGTK